MKKVLLSMIVALAGLAFAGSAFAQKVGPQQATVVPSASRTASYTGTDISARLGDVGADFYAVTSSIAGGTLTFNIQAKTPQGTYVTVLSSTGQTSAGTVKLSVGPHLTSVANTAQNSYLPTVYRVTVTHANSSAATYSVGVDKHTSGQ